MHAYSYIYSTHYDPSMYTCYGIGFSAEKRVKKKKNERLE